MKIEIRDGHHYVDVSHEPEPKSVIEQFFTSVHPEVDLTKSNIEFMDEDAVYITSVQEIEEVIEDFYSRKGMSLK